MLLTQGLSVMKRSRYMVMKSVRGVESHFHSIYVIRRASNFGDVPFTSVLLRPAHTVDPSFPHRFVCR